MRSTANSSRGTARMCFLYVELTLSHHWRACWFRSSQLANVRPARKLLSITGVPRAPSGWHRPAHAPRIETRSDPRTPPSRVREPSHGPSRPPPPPPSSLSPHPPPPRPHTHR